MNKIDMYQSDYGHFPIGPSLAEVLFSATALRMTWRAKFLWLFPSVETRLHRADWIENRLRKMAKEAWDRKVTIRNVDLDPDTDLIKVSWESIADEEKA